MQNQPVPGTSIFSVSVYCHAANPSAQNRQIVTPLLNLSNKIYQQETSASGRHWSKQDSVKHWGKTAQKAFEDLLTMHLLFSQQFISHLELLPLMVFALWWRLQIFSCEWHITYLSVYLSIYQSINQLFLIGTKHPFPPHVSPGITMGTKSNWLKLELHDFLLALKCK